MSTPTENADDSLLGLINSMESSDLADPTHTTPEQVQSAMINAQLESSNALVTIAETLTEEDEAGETVLDVLKGIRTALTDIVGVARVALGQNPTGV